MHARYLPRIHRTVVGCLLATAFPAFADEVVFADGGILAGRMLMLKEDGTIDFESPLAGEALVLKGEHVTRVTLDTPLPADLPGDTRIDLANGDFLTGTFLDYAPDTGARIRVDGIGEFNVPRNSLRALAPGVRPAEVIYRGPDEEQNWTAFALQFDTAWTYSDGVLWVNGTGRIGRMLELPDHYRIRFNLRWQGQPNFMITFADPFKDPTERVDRYYLQFGSAGLEIKREAATGPRYRTVASLNRRPDEFPDNSMDIEIRVDRKESAIHLAINGLPVGRFIDPTDNPPIAGGISLVSNARRGNPQEIRNLIIHRLSDRPPLPVAGDRPAPALDTLVMRNGDTHSGKILSIRDAADGRVFALKADHREEPLETREADIAAVIFATGDDAPAAALPEGKFLLELHEHGHLAVTTLSFDGQEARATHPLLGGIRLPREGISALKHRDHETSQPATPGHAGEMRFLNGNHIFGRMVAIDREHVVWEGPVLKNPAAFITREIHHVSLDMPPRPPATDVREEITLTLTNGDVVVGQLVSVAEDQIALDTWQAGRLTFRRPMVRSLTMRNLSDTIFRGPGPLADWTQPDPIPVWTAGEFNSVLSAARGTIARKIPFPDEFMLEFDVQWIGALNLGLLLLADDPGAEPSNLGYEIQVMRNNILIRRRDEIEWFGKNHRAMELRNGEQAKIRFLVSTRTGKIAYFVNDRLLDVWIDTDIDRKKLGSAIHFTSLGTSPTAISRIEVAKWDGILNEAPEPENQEEPPTPDFFLAPAPDPPEPMQDTIVLRDGKRHEGKILSILNGKILLADDTLDTPVLVENVRSLALGPADLEEPKRELGDIRAWFADGSSMVFRIDGATEDGKAAKGYGQAFDNAAFDLSAISKLEFNLYDLSRMQR